MRTIALVLIGLGLFTAALPARAHRTSDAFLALDVRGAELSGPGRSRCATSTSPRTSMPIATARLSGASCAARANASSGTC